MHSLTEDKGAGDVREGNHAWHGESRPRPGRLPEGGSHSQPSRGPCKVVLSPQFSLAYSWCSINRARWKGWRVLGTPSQQRAGAPPPPRPRSALISGRRA